MNKVINNEGFINVSRAIKCACFTDEYNHGKMRSKFDDLKWSIDYEQDFLIELCNFCAQYNILFETDEYFNTDGFEPLYESDINKMLELLSEYDFKLISALLLVYSVTC